MTTMTMMTSSNAPISLLFILLLVSFVVAMAGVVAPSLLQKESKISPRNERLEVRPRTKRKCHGERPKRFAEPNNSEALERMLI